MTNESSTSKRLSLSVPGTSVMIDDETPTIGQLLAETDLNQPVAIPSSFLTVDSNNTSATNSQHHHRYHRGRS